MGIEPKQGRSTASPMRFPAPQLVSRRKNPRKHWCRVEKVNLCCGDSCADLTIAHSRLLGCQVFCESPDSASPVSRGPRYVISSPQSYLYISTRDGTVRRPNLGARGPRVCFCFYPWVTANLAFLFQPCTAWRRILSMFM